MFIKMRKAQSTAEYAILFGVIIGAIVAMQTYVKRGVQARVKDGTDTLTSVSGSPAGGEYGTLKTRSQFEPYYYREEGYKRGSSRSQTGGKTETLKKDNARRIEEDTEVGARGGETENSYKVSDSWQNDSTSN